MLGELVPAYLALCEKGDEFWKRLRPRSLEEVTRLLKQSWQPLHEVAVTEIMRRKVKTGATRSCPRAEPSQPIALCALSGFFAWARSGIHRGRQSNVRYQATA
jgi:hypothetical protein